MIGRRAEIQYLLEMSEREDAQLLAVYGRRRVGKTYLVRKTFEKQLLFEHTGIYNGSRNEQLVAFRDSLVRAGASDVPKLYNWHDAMLELGKLIQGSTRARKILFLDELPWMDTPKSGFLAAFEHFWNGWASAQTNLTIVICGSATSWVINKVLKNKGGLHNRITGSIALKPFTLAECREYSDYMHLAFEERDIVEGYMVLGGIPYYWSHFRKGESLAQGLDRLFFAENAPLRHEFSNLYASLFNEEACYVRIIEALARKRMGLTLQELAETLKIEKGGSCTRQLEALEQCGFIRRYTAWGKQKRNAVYQLIDNFTIFHFAFIEGESNPDGHFWTSAANNPSVMAWKGYAFERVCLQHVEQMKKALGISGVITRVYEWRHTPDDVYPVGAQIDLMIERADRIINVCEMKWSDDLFVIDKDYEAKLRSKLNVFRSVTGTRLALHLTMVTTYGVARNKYSNSIQSEIKLEDLFARLP